MGGLEGGGEETQTGKDGERARAIEKVRMKSRKKRREHMQGQRGSGWVRGWRWSDRWQDERDKQQHHFSSLLTGLPSTTHDDRRQNGHPNKHQCSGSDTQHQAFNSKLSNSSTAAPGTIYPDTTICQLGVGHPQNKSFCLTTVRGCFVITLKCDQKNNCSVEMLQEGSR